MNIVEFPDRKQDDIITAPEWLRKTADIIEEHYGKELKLSCSVLSFVGADGAVYCYDSLSNGDTNGTLRVVGLLTLTQQHLLDRQAE